MRTASTRFVAFDHNSSSRACLRVYTQITWQLLEQTPLPAHGAIEVLLHRLCQFVRSQQPQLPRASNASPFLDTRAKKCSHVFLPFDRLRPPLQLFLRRPVAINLTCNVLLNWREEIVSIDHLKAAAIESTESSTPDQPAIALPGSPSSPIPTPVNSPALSAKIFIIKTIETVYIRQLIGILRRWQYETCWKSKLLYRHFQDAKGLAVHYQSNFA